jgi:hypothetical protein
VELVLSLVLQELWTSVKVGLAVTETDVLNADLAMQCVQEHGYLSKELKRKLDFRRIEHAIRNL